MKILYELPNPREYVELRMAAGMSSKEEAVVKKALSHSIFSVVIRNDESKLVGMGRIIGDGGCYFQIVDIAVNSTNQNQGIETVIMYEMINYLNENVPADAEVILVADVPAISFYQKYGFDYTYPKSISLSRK